MSNEYVWGMEEVLEKKPENKIKKNLTPKFRCLIWNVCSCVHVPSQNLIPK